MEAESKAASGEARRREVIIDGERWVPESAITELRREFLDTFDELAQSFAKRVIQAREPKSSPADLGPCPKCRHLHGSAVGCDAHLRSILAEATERAEAEVGGAFIWQGCVPPNAPKPKPRRWIFEETGETREPKVGEWFTSVVDMPVRCAGGQIAPRPILRLVEKPE